MRRGSCAYFGAGPKLECYGTGEEIKSYYLLLFAVQLKSILRCLDNVLKTVVPKISLKSCPENIRIAFLNQIFNQCSGASQSRYQCRSGLLAEGKLFRVGWLLSFPFRKPISQFLEKCWFAIICFCSISTTKVYMKLLFAVAYRPLEID